MSIDWGKPVQTRGGHGVRIYTTDGADPEMPVIGERLDVTGKWIMFKRPLNGKWNEKDDSFDLVNVPQQLVGAIPTDGLLLQRVKRLIEELDGAIHPAPDTAAMEHWTGYIQNRLKAIVEANAERTKDP